MKLENGSRSLSLEMLHRRVEIEKQDYRKQQCNDDSSDREHHQGNSTKKVKCQNRKFEIAATAILGKGVLISI